MQETSIHEPTNKQQQKRVRHFGRGFVRGGASRGSCGVVSGAANHRTRFGVEEIKLEIQSRHHLSSLPHYPIIPTYHLISLLTQVNPSLALCNICYYIIGIHLIPNKNQTLRLSRSSPNIRTQTVSKSSILVPPKQTIKSLLSLTTTIPSISDVRSLHSEERSQPFWANPISTTYTPAQRNRRQPSQGLRYIMHSSLSELRFIL